jgi:subtilase family serine protease/subtilisin family serine protease
VVKTLAQAAVAALALLAAAHAPAGRLDPALETRMRGAMTGEKLRVIVEMKEQARAAELVRAAPKGARKARLKALVAGLKDKAKRHQAQLHAELERERTLGAVERVVPFWVFNGFAVTATESAIRKLAARDDVLEVRLDQQIPEPPRPTGAAEATGTTEWNIALIRAPEVWALDPRYNGEGTVIGSFDSGVDLLHNDLYSRYRGDHSISWFDPYGEHSLPTDLNGHGTHTTGTALGGDAGGTQIGVAPGAKWIAAKAWADDGVGYASAFHQIFEWFLAPGGDPDNAPDVVNNSWAFVAAGCNGEFAADIQAWRAAEIFPAFAAGNSGPSPGSVRSPGAYAESFAVGATDSFDEVASFSSRGPSPCTGLDKPDISAPGAAIRSAVPGGGYTAFSGTSMATPHIAGAVAVLRSIKPDMTIEELATALTLSAADVAQPGPDNESGAGRLDLSVAAEIAIRGPSAPVVKAVATVPTAPETGPGTGAITFTRTGSTDAALEVKFSVSGTATAGSDYVALPPSIIIPAGSASATLLVTPLDDPVAEANEMVLVAISPDPAYIASWSKVASVIIVSDELFPDLTLSTVSTPASAGAGDTVTVGDTTRNQGAGAADASLTQYFFSANSTLETTDMLLAARQVPALAPGASSNASITLTIPADTVTGTWYLLVKADGVDSVPESSEINNTTWQSILIGPDLSVSAFSAAAGAGAGASISVTDTIRNQGGGAAAASTARYFLSSNFALDSGDLPLGSRAVPALAAGASSSASTLLTIPANTPTGAWYLIVKADGEDALPESSETNNVFYRTIAIGSDLIVSAMTVPAAASAGQSIAVSDTTSNPGGGAAQASVTQYFLSANSTLGDGDIALGSRSVPALAGGASNAGSATLTVPAGTATGTWYVIAKADAADAVPETTENNNTTARALQIGPDLVISPFSAPAAASAGQSIAITETTRNQGGGAAPASVTQYFLSLNSTVDAGDIALGGRNVPVLPGGASSSGSATLTIPVDTATGSWYLIAKADAQDSLAETAETNNFATRLIRIGADLAISALSAPATVGAGQSITVTDTTKNQGGGSAPASVTHFVLSADAVADAGDTLLGSRAVPALAAGGSSMGSVVLTIPAGTPTGRRYLVAVADGGGSVSETVETNNANVWTLQIGTDLIVLALTAPSTGGAGVSITATDTTKNQGGAAAAASVTRFFLSSNSTHDAGDIALGSRSVPLLSAAASSTGSATLTIPAGTATGTWYLIARSDADDIVAETSEVNNNNWRSIQIGADLRVSAFAVPSTAGGGQSITLTDTTANPGGGAAPASVTRYFLSANTTLDASDALLASRDVTALAPGASSAGSTAVTIPPNTATGTWYLIAQADAAGGVTEVSELNNTTWRSLQIGVDLAVTTLSVPAAAGPGQSITVGDTTKNQGSGSAQASLTQYFLSSNSTLEGTDALLGARAVTALGSGASSSGSASLTIPANTTAGTWYVIAKADGDGAVAETSESNNTSTRTLQIGADLIVYALITPVTAAAGQTIAASDTIRNQGGGPAGTSITRYFLSTNSTLEAGDTALGERSVAALAVGASSAGPVTLVIPPDTATGTWYLLVKTDADGSVAESAETNNVNWRSIQIGPDLSVSGATAPASAAAGQSIAVSDTTRNQGAGAAPASVTRYFLSSNWIWDAADTELGSRDVQALAGGASSAGSATLTIPAGTGAGAWYVIVKADGDAAVVEAAENNNVFYRSIQITNGP